MREVLRKVCAMILSKKANEPADDSLAILIAIQVK